MKKLIWIGISFNFIFFLFFFKAYLQPQLEIEFKSPELPFFKKEIFSPIQKDDSIELAIKKIDSIKNPLSFNELEFKNLGTDSLIDVLLVGDSQLENLRKPIRKRLMDNNHHLVASVIWYGSSSKHWANSDTLNFFISKFKPDFVLIALGLNELFVNDLEKRKNYSQMIKAKLEKYQMPFYFIGPAAWVEDKGITRVLQETFGELYYPSHLLELDRASDGRHPSQTGATVWFNNVADQMTQRGILDLSLVKDSVYKGESPTILIQVPKE